MTPEPAAPPNLLRQQLLLAQVRIMELEDARDALGPRLQELEGLLRDAQLVADRKLDEAAHLEKVLAETRARADELAGLHTAASRDLAATRERLAAAEAQAGERAAALTQRDAELHARDTELRAIKSSRAWRWTAWLR